MASGVSSIDVNLHVIYEKHSCKGNFNICFFFNNNMCLRCVFFSFQNNYLTNYKIYFCVYRIR